MAVARWGWGWRPPLHIAAFVSWRAALENCAVPDTRIRTSFEVARICGAIDCDMAFLKKCKPDAIRSIAYLVCRRDLLPGQEFA